MDRQVLITGAGAGIGLSLAEKFLDNDWQVTAHYHRSVAELKELQKRFGPGKLILKKVDFRKPSEVKRFLPFVRGQKWDALINNAAVYDFSRRAKNRIQEIQSVLLVNTVVPTLIAERVFEGMKKRRQGSIVNISSIGVKYGSRLEHVFYGISKQGLEALTRSLAREGAPFHVLVNTVRPGLTDTPFHDRVKRNLKKRVRMIPLKRMARPDEIAGMVYYLCARNTYITNEVISVAGGE